LGRAGWVKLNQGNSPRKDSLQITDKRAYCNVLQSCSFAEDSSPAGHGSCGGIVSGAAGWLAPRMGAWMTSLSIYSRMAVDLVSPSCGYTRFVRCSVWTCYAVYDPVLSVWPISHISLHRLRLDLRYPKSLFSSCPSRRRGESEGTVCGPSVLRVFEQDGEEVARTRKLAESGCRVFVSF
jgi:hypothetical protein